MIDVLIALTPAAIAGLIFFGLPALKVLVLSTLSAVLTEAILLRAPLTPQGIFGDGSAAVTGLLLGLILPPTVSWWVPVVGSVLAIALVKLAFGGLGHNIFNPALGARAILLLAFTSQLVKFTAPFDAVTTATPLLSMRSFSWSLVWGNVGGSIGETSVIAILLGGAYLLYKGHINWRNPLGYVGSAFVLALLWGLDPWYTITAGGLLFAAVFMATDMVTSPVTSLGQFIFGIGCGVLTMVIRQFTSLPEGVTFAVLTMNALSPALESLTIPRIFGLSISQETWKKGIAVTTAAVVVFAGFLVLLDRSEPSAVPVFSRGQYLPIAELLGAEDYEVVENNGTTYYLVRDEEGNPLQTVFVAEQGGFNGPIRFLLALDAEHRIAGVRVLEHREDPGLGELATRPAFLEQFVGLDQDSSFSIGAGIQAVTGATISSRALATGVERALVQFNRAFFPADEAAVLVDGTYFGQADSFGGLLELEVVVEDGKITAVNVLRHSDTPGISDPAYNTIPQRIVQANSPQVDAASGATVSSQAIIKAVEQALAQAAGEPASAAPAEEEAAAYPDGTYYGQADSFGGKLELEVVVEGGRIAAVNVLQHSDTPGISDLAYQQVPQAIVEANSPQVDAASGATISSKAIMQAVEQALEQASGAPAAEPYAITVADGVHRGRADGFGGELVVEVTVEGGRITAIEVVENSETPFIADNAIKNLLPAIIEAQGPVDVISGATYTSKAILEAVEKAVSGAGADQAEAGAYVDGTYRAEVDSFGGKLELEVVVEGGRIAAINVLQHSDTPGISDLAYQQVPQAIVEANSPQVDAASGATISSKAIMKAVEEALKQAGDAPAVQPFTITVADGVHRGRADGFGGELVVEVTVEGGRITAIEVVENSETPFVADNAFKKLIPAIIEAQGPVDVVSGATFTSRAVEEAVRDALSVKEDQ